MWYVCGMHVVRRRYACGTYVVRMWYVCGTYVICTAMLFQILNIASDVQDADTRNNLNSVIS